MWSKRAWGSDGVMKGEGGGCNGGGKCKEVEGAKSREALIPMKE